MLRLTTERHADVSWRSLFRTTRAPVSILAIAALSLALPSQTGDELAALREMHVGPLSGLVILQLSLGFLSLSAWYWARAALSTRFGVNDSLEARSALRRCSRATFNAVEAFLSLLYDYGKVRPGMPVWVLNGTDVTSGGRMLTVPFASRIGMAWPFYASIDLLGLLGADVAISTAINNSARFPYLEPSGEVVSVNDPPHQMHNGGPEVLDGGVFDNEGLEAALEIAQWLKRKSVHGRPVQPIIVQATANADIGVAVANRVVRCFDAPIDVPTDPPPSPGRLQLLAPVMGLYNVRAAHAALLPRHTRDEFCGGDRRAFFHFYLFSAPDRDIPLNWMLSTPAVAAIQQQLDSPGNASELECLRKVLAGASGCGETPATAFDLRVRSRPGAEN